MWHALAMTHNQMQFVNYQEKQEHASNVDCWKSNVKKQDSSFRSTYNKIQDWLHNVQFIFSCMLMCVCHVFFVLIPNFSPKQLLVLASIKFNNLKFLKVLKSHNVPRFYCSLIFSIVPRSSSCGTSKGSSKHTFKPKNVSIPKISTLQCKKMNVSTCI
jgi:hypothetical protein